MEYPYLIIEGDSDAMDGFPGGFWGRYIRGFDPSKHCQPSLIGERFLALRGEVRTHVQMLIDEDLARTHPHFYVCGVTYAWTWERNFHLAAEWAPGEEATETTWNGFRVTLVGGRKLEIPDLPLDYLGAPKSYTTCRNWRFGIKHYGVPEGYEAPKVDTMWKGKSGKKKSKLPTLETALLDGRAVKIADNVVWGGDGFLVPSLTGHKMHPVRLNEVAEGRHTCGCIHGKHYKWGAKCVHVKAALIYESRMVGETEGEPE
jgi:hypothetical protein